MTQGTRTWVGAFVLLCVVSYSAQLGADEAELKKHILSRAGAFFASFAVADYERLWPLFSMKLQEDSRSKDAYSSRLRTAGVTIRADGSPHFAWGTEGTPGEVVAVVTTPVVVSFKNSGEKHTDYVTVWVVEKGARSDWYLLHDGPQSSWSSPPLKEPFGTVPR